MSAVVHTDCTLASDCNRHLPRDGANSTATGVLVLVHHFELLRRPAMLDARIREVVLLVLRELRE
ncbi:hypothetical protein DF164_31380 [Burkholderia stagnalis]|nr:hypothetical protein DF164_31380 [Burkholderia stagnalis]RQY62450.1 hypothetical protein DF110_35685 [Burkholderia stagnalis]